MPELAEVEFYRKQWDPGLGAVVERVALHARKRLFRGLSPERLIRRMEGAVLLASQARGKQMLFQFSTEAWLGIHLGMTGQLRIEPPGFRPQRHDHLVLVQRERALVFSDPRLFGRVLFHEGGSAPEWWKNLPPDLLSRPFRSGHVAEFLRRHRQLPIKAALMLQEGFPGIGNWMADEILWRCGLHPKTSAGRLDSRQCRSLWRTLRWVCRGALRSISVDFSGPPQGWFFHVRWEAGGSCPKDGTQLARATVGGRTTAWCPVCQPP